MDASDAGEELPMGGAVMGRPEPSAEGKPITSISEAHLVYREGIVARPSQWSSRSGDTRPRGPAIVSNQQRRAGSRGAPRGAQQPSFGSRNKGHTGGEKSLRDVAADPAGCA